MNWKSLSSIESFGSLRKPSGPLVLLEPELELDEPDVVAFDEELEVVELFALAVLAFAVRAAAGRACLRGHRDEEHVRPRQRGERDGGSALLGAAGGRDDRRPARGG